MKTKSLLLLFIILVLESIPTSAYHIAGTITGKATYETSSYFVLNPFGFPGFAPFITAILTSTIAILLLLSLFFKMNHTLLQKLLLISILFSLGPTITGLRFLSFWAISITLLMVLEYQIMKKIAQ